MKRGCQLARYVAADFTAASVAWLLFNRLRYELVASSLGYVTLGEYLTSLKVWEGQALVPLFWLMLHYFSGYYNKVFGKSRLKEIFTTLLTVVVGVTLLFFVVVLNDLPRSFEIYYRLYFSLLALQFGLTYVPRLMITQRELKRTKRGLPLAEVTGGRFSEMEKNIKYWGDKCFALLALILLSPLYLWIIRRVRRESPGPALFKQERIGYRGKPFMMYKFRTMYEGAEENGPLLSCVNDSRVTPFGRFLRKYRLDELPQFWNVLKGDMSVVGPRPERRFFIEQIVQKAPQYALLQNVRPGITSLGMVKYGYACNVDEMIERMKYDMLYYDNRSLIMDLTILVYTVKTVATGKGV